MKSKAKQNKKPLTTVRAPYYEIADAIWSLRQSAPESDARFKQLIHELDKIQTTLYKHLNDTYLWD